MGAPWAALRGARSPIVDLERRIAISRDGAAARPIASSHHSTDADGVLVARARNGDARAYDLLVRRYLARAMAIARRLLHDPDDAEDLVQDAFMRALARIGSFDEQRAFGPWFFKLLINAGLNARKFRALRSATSERDDLPSLTPSPLELAERDDLCERFRAALDRLRHVTRGWRERFARPKGAGRDARASSSSAHASPSPPGSRSRRSASARGGNG